MKNVKTMCVMIIALLSMQTSFAHFTSKGPYGGSVTCMYVHDSIIFVGTLNGGVYRATDVAATSWRYANHTGLTSGNITAITSLGNYVFAATAGGIFKSSDLGNTWTNTGLNNFASCMISAENLLVAGKGVGGIVISQDTGNTWTEANTGLGSLLINGLAYSNSKIYAATNNGIYMSADKGNSWTSIGDSNMYVTSVVASGGKIFALGVGEIYISDTSTINWTTNDSLFQFGIKKIFAIDNTIYVTTAHGIFTSPNNNISWTSANTDPDYDQETTSLISYNNKLYAGTRRNGIIQSNSIANISWSLFNIGLNDLYTISLYNSGQLIITSTDAFDNYGASFLFISKDLGAKYVRIDTAAFGICFGGGKLYIASLFKGVLMSSDTGTTWTSVNTGLTNWVIRKIIATQTHIFVVTYNGEVFSSSLNSINWTKNTGLPADIRPTAFATDGEHHVFLGTESHGVFMCMDNTTWEASNDGLTDLYVTSLTVSGGNLFAGTEGGGVFKSPLMGTWTQINTGLPTTRITSMYASGQRVVAGYKGGISYSYDNGATWHQPNTNMYIPEFADVTSISFSESSTRIFIGTPANSLYSNSIAELPVGIPEATLNANAIKLYPNPNNGKFTVDINNATTNAVSVFDVFGKLIKTISVEKKGVIEISENLSSGIYFIQIQSDKGNAMKKIIVE